MITFDSVTLKAFTEENSDFTNWVEKNTITAGTQSDTDNNEEDALPF